MRKLLKISSLASLLALTACYDTRASKLDPVDNPIGWRSAEAQCEQQSGNDSLLTQRCMEAKENKIETFRADHPEITARSDHYFKVIQGIVNDTREDCTGGQAVWNGGTMGGGTACTDSHGTTYISTW